MEALKAERKVVRSAVTKLVNKIGDLFEKSEDADTDEYEELLDLLLTKEDQLGRLDQGVKALLKAEDLEGEFGGVEVYKEKIEVWKFRLNKKIKTLGHISEVKKEVNASKNNVRLPKIDMIKFSGDVMAWSSFWNAYEVSVHNNADLTKVEKFNYLKSYLRESALDAVEGFSISDANYDSAIDILENRFGRRDVLINAHMNSFLDLQPVRSANDLKGLRKLYDLCNVKIRSLDALQIKTDSFGNLLCPLLLRCLPREIAFDYAKSKGTDDCFDVDGLMSFVKQEIESRERAVSLCVGRNQCEEKQSRFIPSTQFRSRGKEERMNSRFGRVNQISAVSFCVFCSEDSHDMTKCRMTPAEKKKSLVENNRCFLCHEEKCWTRGCRSGIRCKVCNSKFHSQWIHEDKRKDVQEKDVLTSRISPEYLSNQVGVSKNSVISPLLKVKLKCDEKFIDGIVDTGAQLSVIKTEVVPLRYQNPRGTVLLTSAFGHNLKAPLINVPLSKVESDAFEEPVYLTCAMVDTLTSDLLLSPSAVTDFNLRVSEELNLCNPVKCERASLDKSNLKEIHEEVDVGTHNAEDCEAATSGDSFDELVECFQTSSSVGGMDPMQSGTGTMSDSQKFREEQIIDPSLSACWEDAKNHKKGFSIIDDFLYHTDRILGEKVKQLVVPKDRRKQILNLAHSSLWGGHLRKKKTADRIRYSFYWPGVKSDVDRFCENCSSCQLQAKRKPFDDVPITPVSRPAEPFAVINVDLIGPMEPASHGYKYVLCAVDQCTRWPEAIPLRRVDAKSTCEALLQIFSRTGIPKVVATDQGTNFTSALTQEFLKRLGSSPRFSTPCHPSSNGLVERFNAVLKSMIHHTMREHRMDWDSHLPFLLWAYREVPNATTGVSPFQMLYGRCPTGPLSILKSTWTNEMQIPTGQLKSVTDYLNELKAKLEIAAEHAGVTAVGKQEAYSCYRNRKTRHKEFQEGDRVIVLIPDSEHKVYARWTGPVTIVKKKTAYSYLVQMSDGSTKHVHANKIRPFKVSTNNIGVIYEVDDDFGEIESIPRKLRFNHKIEVNLGHLEKTKQRTILEMLQRHTNLQSGVPRIAKVGEHSIKLMPGSLPKRQKPYRIPEALREEVDRQIDELLQLGLIVPSESEYAHPIVCVSKKDGSMRMCVDFRYLNAQTEMDSFPMKVPTEMIYRVSKARFITLIDLLKGYWQIKLDPGCRHLTSFVTHRGQYAFTVMPFGLRNAAATFQRTMNKLLMKHRDYADSYIDDIIIFSDDWNSHMKHLEDVLSSLEEANFTVNFKKCDFAKGKIKFLGHVVGSGSHEPDPEKVEAIKNLQSPKTKKDVRSILGLLSYYRNYVPCFSEIAAPLTNLTKRRSPDAIGWLSEHEDAFIKLKEAICGAPACYAPNFKLPFIVYTDASSYAVGACLAQRDESGEEHPIAFASKKLSKAQEKYAVIEKEAYAVIFALRKFEDYIFGSEIVIVSDHNPLKFLTDCASQSPRLQRWSLALQRFHAVVSYRKGKEHLNADSLSRLQANHWKDRDYMN